MEPILDDHMHLDPDHGQGVEAVKDFSRAGGTHLLVVNKPSWHLGDLPDAGADFESVFETTLGAVAEATDVLDGCAWPILGVHPGLISQLTDAGHTPEEAGEIMRAGLDRAGEYVASGAALGLKSGRPHYEVSEAVWKASNAVLKHALSLGADHECAVQLHTEGSEDLTEIAEWAEERGLPAHRVVKHYANGRLKGPTPSVICQRDELRRAAESNAPFMMETDFIDDPDRPGAVLGPKTVPRRVTWLREEGYEGAIRTAHVETPEEVYGIDTVSTLDE
ncbi:TatD family hydrolase [Halalkalicoccus jeotgali]|uniref:TatD-related deoxyribonuclease n=1 Tax=Halalkalicoccus jeotgali (strain DSM 18796 / CECT 7217 / JCM 14584 / KCTC 4019 / B3) TaxID=795797 RepID=D8JAL6_HALJB|nr:TatD family hydrolase [Halalkalicoccus jeotgali]ADJ14738.1 TatD-related deoxyribonuclease [Halalkalicoccus jeotgali B3]ELY39320.1 TatD-related deoxyribonuclease [Halalkalicoccus jeotgali B3]